MTLRIRNFLRKINFFRENWAISTEILIDIYETNIIKYEYMPLKIWIYRLKNIDFKSHFSIL